MTLKIKKSDDILHRGTQEWNNEVKILWFWTPTEESREKMQKK